MTISFAERKARASLPFIRLMQSHVPLRFSNWLIAQGSARVPLDSDVVRETITADGVSCTWIIPRNNSEDKVLLYLHGGGFVYRLTPPHLQIGAYLAKRLNIRVLMVDYRTAPDDPYPAPLEDCATVYHWLVNKGFLGKDIVIGGDSAGGNLALTTLLTLRDAGSPLPAAAACLSPVTDLTPEGEQLKGSKDPLISPKIAKFYNRSYIGNNDPHDPLVSPVFGDLGGLPPLLIHAGEEERLRIDAIRITDLARSAGVDVRLEIYPRMWHVWQINLSMPQATQSLEDIASYFKTHLKIE